MIYNTISEGNQRAYLDIATSVFGYSNKRIWIWQRAYLDMAMSVFGYSNERVWIWQ